jgi:hypothetical protein
LIEASVVIEIVNIDFEPLVSDLVQETFGNLVAFLWDDLKGGFNAVGVV